MGTRLTLFRLELRPEASKAMVYLSPLIAVGMTIITAMFMFALLGVDPVDAIATFFIEPISTLDGVTELCVKGYAANINWCRACDWFPVQMFGTSAQKGSSLWARWLAAGSR